MRWRKCILRMLPGVVARVYGTSASVWNICECMEHLPVPRSHAACGSMRGRRYDARDPPFDCILATRPSGVERCSTALSFHTRQET